MHEKIAEMKNPSKLSLFFFPNGNIHNVVSTLPNVVKVDVEIENVVSTLLYVVQINVEIDNVDSNLFNVVNFNVDVNNVVSTSYQPNKYNLETTLKCLLGRDSRQKFSYTHFFIRVVSKARL